MRPLLLSAVAAVLLLTGCSEDAPAPRTLPPATAPASPSAAASAPLPSPRQTGVAGQVEQGVLAYFAGINAMFASTDTAAYRATFAPGCSGCKQFEASIAEVYAAGNHLVGARDEITSLRIVPGPDGVGGADVSFRVPAYRVEREDGTLVKAYEASTGAITMTLARQPGGRFLVTGVVNAAAS